jgi:hypothetical protein
MAIASPERLQADSSMSTIKSLEGNPPLEQIHVRASFFVRVLSKKKRKQTIDQTIMLEIEAIKSNIKAAVDL